MFVDASALVAILTREEEEIDFLDRIEAASVVATSSVAIYEASHAVARKTGIGLRRSLELVERFLEESDIAVYPLVHEDARNAVDASARYGKGSGHPARLNMGDCFSYAMAKRAGMALLYKGDDFARTDLA